jgi:hypothetical protein
MENAMPVTGPIRGVNGMGSAVAGEDAVTYVAEMVYPDGVNNKHAYRRYDWDVLRENAKAAT